MFEFHKSKEKVIDFVGETPFPWGRINCIASFSPDEQYFGIFGTAGAEIFTRES